MTNRFWIGILACALWVGCSKKDPPQQFGPPRRIRPTIAELSHVKAVFELTEASQVTFSAPGRSQTPKGTFSEISGSLEVDTLDLRKTHGTVHVDLASLTMEGDGDGGSQAATRRALKWFGLGERVPLKERTTIRTAEFTVEQIVDWSATAAHLGKRIAVDDAPNDSLAEPEVRLVTLTALGPLRLRFAQVRVAAAVEVRFHYAAPAITGESPTRITVTSRSPFVVSLQAHEVLPRNEAGVVLADELSLLGREVGREARVSATLVAERR